ncbi:MAG: glycerate kinase, partial [Thermoguttaceae bacterium]|nr:glycerate kinase [Thermoguttaceae bacterium]
NPFSGPTGAAYVFAPQKGADDAMVARLDAGLDHIGALMRDVSGGTFTPDLPGAGAAGGMGGGMCAFFGSKLQMGIETVLNTVRFDELVRTADWVFTGEGKIDSQSLRGKVVLGVAARTQKAGVPLIAVVGDVGDEIDEAYDRGVTAIFSINHVAVPFHAARRRAEQDLAAEMENILRLIKASMK